MTSGAVVLTDEKVLVDGTWALGTRQWFSARARAVKTTYVPWSWSIAGPRLGAKAL
jgi:hypothetical protein